MSLCSFIWNQFIFLTAFSLLYHISQKPPCIRACRKFNNHCDFGVKKWAKLNQIKSLIKNSIWNSREKWLNQICERYQFHITVQQKYNDIKENGDQQLCTKEFILYLNIWESFIWIIFDFLLGTCQYFILQWQWQMICNQCYSGNIYNKMNTPC